MHFSTYAASHSACLSISTPSTRLRTRIISAAADSFGPSASGSNNCRWLGLQLLESPDSAVLGRRFPLEGVDMKFSAQLDVSMVAVESTDEVALLLDLESPEVATEGERAAATLQVVLDRSGSMHGAPLDGAIEALCGLVARLDARDNFGVVVFDDHSPGRRTRRTARRQGPRRWLSCAPSSRAG